MQKQPSKNSSFKRLMVASEPIVSEADVNRVYFLDCDTTEYTNISVFKNQKCMLDHLNDLGDISPGEVYEVTFKRIGTLEKNGFHIKK